MTTKLLDCGCEFQLDEKGHILLDFDNIPLTCKKTWDLLSSGRTKGVFQLESPLGKVWANKLKPENIEHLAALVSILRPGCLKSLSGSPPKSMTARYCDRKNGIEKVESLHPSLDVILKDTYQIMVYQENAILIAKEIAGFSLEQGDSLRKAIGKKLPEVMAKVKIEFLEGCKKTGIVDDKKAEEIFGWIQESQRYSFNKSHAVCYAIDAYYSAYCKAHFPLQFYCSYLQFAKSKQKPHEEIFELVTDAKQQDISVMVPDFRSEKLNIHIVDNKYIRFGISNLKNVGESSLNKIIEARIKAEILIGKKIKDWVWLDYLIFFSDNIGSRPNTAFISSGALDYFLLNRNIMLFEFDIWNKLTPKEKKYIQEHKDKNLKDSILDCSENGCIIKRKEKLLSFVSSLNNPPHLLNDTPDWISWTEKEYLGAPISCSKVDGCNNSISATCTCKEVVDGKSGYIVVAVEIFAAREITTKNGQKMAFLVISDGTSAIENIICFPNQWVEMKAILYPGNTALIQLEKARGRQGYIIKQCFQI